MTEEWRDIPDAPGYKASSLGRIRSGRSFKILNPTMTSRGYLVCEVFFVQKRVNRLVCAAFHGEAPSIAHHAAHKDGDKKNNVPENLYWATAMQNSQDLRAHGNQVRGSQVKISKLKEYDVKNILGMRKSGMTIRKIHREHFAFVSYAAVCHICTGRTWKHASK